MVAELALRVTKRNRSFTLVFGVLRGADTGAADAMVGNAMLRKDMYDGVVDVGRQVAVLRQLKDGRGPLEIPIRMQVSALGVAMVGQQADRTNRASHEFGEDVGVLRLQQSFVA